ncbi:hypothetical protein Tco_0257248 [Tanacetum coccineum]
MEGLHVAFRDALAANMFQGVIVGYSKIHLSHLFYANNVIVASEWNQNDMENIITSVLNVFYRDSGLKISINKSNIYGVRCHIMRLSKWLWAQVLKTVIKILESIRASFVWGATEDIKKLAWIKWSNIDTWLGDMPLCVRYNRLFHLEKAKDCLISDRIVNGSSSWDLRRLINNGRSHAYLIHLLVEIVSVEVSEDRDSCVWSLFQDGSFSIPFLVAYEDWDSWDTSKESKERAYVILAATCWVLWRYRTNVTFNSQCMRKMHAQALTLVVLSDAALYHHFGTSEEADHHGHRN